MHALDRRIHYKYAVLLAYGGNRNMYVSVAGLVKD